MTRHITEMPKITDLTVDLIKEGVESIRPGTIVSGGFKKRHHLQIGKEYMTSTLSFKDHDRQASISISEITIIKQEVNMNKQYRLEIQYPVDEENIELAFNLKKLDGVAGEMIDTRVIEFVTGDRKGFDLIPESWITPIEDKVMTAGESWEAAEYSDMWNTEESKSAFIYGFKEGEKNQWINHAELRDTVNEFIDKTEGKHLTGGVVNDWVRVFKKHSENIKPIEEI